jgi:hypothetical protein
MAVRDAMQQEDADLNSIIQYRRGKWVILCRPEDIIQLKQRQ